ncbi:MAG: hypothetical protein GDA39_10075 [Hyphomonadaceae bacterium]|nr:hypothetical protein [Hyphomonadaceae bacterium]MBC6413179.1 hypothetical protein [Hyphomonadaceae bacterium]
MTEWKVDVPEELVSELEKSICRGPVVDVVHGQPQYFLTEDAVERLNGL